MKVLVFLHALAWLLCAVAIALLVLGFTRLSLGALLIVVFVQIWSLEELRHRVATSNREIEK